PPTDLRSTCSSVRLRAAAGGYILQALRRVCDRNGPAREDKQCNRIQASCRPRVRPANIHPDAELISSRTPRVQWRHRAGLCRKESPAEANLQVLFPVLAYCAWHFFSVGATVHCWLRPVGLAFAAALAGSLRYTASRPSYCRPVPPRLSGDHSIEFF